MKYQAIKGVKHWVFDSISEFEHYFKSRGLEVPALQLDWRDAKKGEWTIADDEGIVQILQRKQTKYGWFWIRTVVGTFRQGSGYQMHTDFSIVESRYSFSGKDEDRWKKISNRDHVTRKELIFVTNLIRGMSIKQAYHDAFGDSKHWREKSFLLMKQDRIMSELRNASKEAAKKLDLNMEYIIKSLMDISKESDDKTKLGALKELRGILEAIEDSEATYGATAIQQAPLEAIDMGRIEKEKLEALSDAK